MSQKENALKQVRSICDGATTLSMMTLSITALIIVKHYASHSADQHSALQFKRLSSEKRKFYTECHNLAIRYCLYRDRLLNPDVRKT